MLAGPGLTRVHPVLAHAALEPRGTVAEIGGAVVNADASVLAQGRDFCALAQSRLLAGGQRKVAERPSPSLEAQALVGGPRLEAVGIAWTGLLGTEVHQRLAAASCVAGWAEAAGTLRAVLAGGPVPAGAVCAAGTDPSLTAWALEAWGAEAGGGAGPVHTGAPIEARCRGTVVNAGLAVEPGVARRAGAGVAPRAGATGATIETGC